MTTIRHSVIQRLHFSTLLCQYISDHFGLFVRFFECHILLLFKSEMPGLWSDKNNPNLTIIVDRASEAVVHIYMKGLSVEIKLTKCSVGI